VFKDLYISSRNNQPEVYRLTIKSLIPFFFWRGRESVPFEFDGDDDDDDCLKHWSVQKKRWCVER